MRLALAGALGAALSAAYLLPALVMRDLLTADAWVGGSGSHYFPENWLLLSGRPIDRFGWTVYAALAGATAAALASALCAWAAATWGGQAVGEGQPARRRVAIGSLATLLVAWLAMSAAAEPAWVHIGMLRQAQFPWRLGVAVAARSGDPDRRRNGGGRAHPGRADAGIGSSWRR